MTDLLRLPYQRVLKYHLLFSELLKQTDVEHAAKECIKETRDSMLELGQYLNECQRDKEDMRKIDEVIKIMHGGGGGGGGGDATRTNFTSLFQSPASATIGDAGNQSAPNAFASLKKYGKHIRDDKLRIKSIDQGERMARTRTFFLFDKALIVCKLKGNYYHYKDTMLMERYTIEESLNANATSASSALHSSTTHSTSSINGLAALTTNNNSSSSQHSLYLISSDRGKINQLIFKNKEQKRAWKECLLSARERLRPSGQPANKHTFELTNFDRELVKCVLCAKHLLGLFFQGYRCLTCSCVAHRQCLARITHMCTLANLPKSLLLPPTTTTPNANSTLRELSSVLNPKMWQQQQSTASLSSIRAQLNSHTIPQQQQQQQQLQQQVNAQQPIERSHSFNAASSSSSSSSSVQLRSKNSVGVSSVAGILYVRAVYKYDGRPAPPDQCRALTFNAGDTIVVADDDDDEWWRGFLFSPSSDKLPTEGYFPRRYI